MINNVSWPDPSQVTATKLTQMVQDETNKADNVHPQYLNVLSAQPLQVWVDFEWTAAAGQNLINERALLHTNAGGNGISFGPTGDVPNFPAGGLLATYFSLLSVQFPKKMLENPGYEITTISTYFLQKNVPGGGFTLAQGDMKFRSVVYEYDNTYALQSTLAQADVSGSADTNWHEYSKTGIDVSGMASNSLIVVDFQVRMSTELTNAANDSIQAFLAFAHVDFLNR